jgi:hypothetical protein
MKFMRTALDGMKASYDLLMGQRGSADKLLDAQGSANMADHFALIGEAMCAAALEGISKAGLSEAGSTAAAAKPAMASAAPSRGAARQPEPKQKTELDTYEELQGSGDYLAAGRYYSENGEAICSQLAEKQLAERKAWREAQDKARLGKL